MNPARCMACMPNAFSRLVFQLHRATANANHRAQSVRFVVYSSACRPSPSRPEIGPRPTFPWLKNGREDADAYEGRSTRRLSHTASSVAREHDTDLEHTAANAVDHEPASPPPPSSSAASPSLRHGEELLEFSDALPISRGEFSELMDAAGVPQGSTIVVGVSGGADSMALALLAREWAAMSPRRKSLVFAVTVDHKLRPESTDEALRVREWLSKRGIWHELVSLSWPDGIPSTNKIMTMAREKRYQALAEECDKKRATFLLTAHQKDDQAETFLIRLSHCSGIEGLASMQPSVSMSPRVTLVRPFLNIGKERLEATCRGREARWVEDPSNGSKIFMRARMRAALDMIDERGLVQLAPDLAAVRMRDHLAEVVAHMQAVKDELNAQATAYLERSSRLVEQFGYAFFNAGQDYKALPREVALRVLARIILCIGGGPYAPSTESLLRVYDKIYDEEGLERGVTLGGCLIRPFNKDRRVLLVCREEQVERLYVATGAETPVRLNEPLLWDGRFQILVMRNRRFGGATIVHDGVPSSQAASASASSTTAPGGEPTDTGDGLADIERVTQQLMGKDQTAVIGPNPRVRQMTPEDWLAITERYPALRKSRWCPSYARRGVPIIVDDRGIIAVPPFSFFPRPELYVAAEFTPRHNTIPLSAYIRRPRRTDREHHQRERSQKLARIAIPECDS